MNEVEKLRGLLREAVHCCPDEQLRNEMKAALCQQGAAQDERDVLLAEARMVIDACLQEVDLPSDLAWMAERASKGRRIYVDDRAVARRPAQTAPQPAHDLYRTGDETAPDAIKDRNGEVVLDLCKRCGQGEADLAATCPGHVRAVAALSAQGDK